MSDRIRIDQAPADAARSECPLVSRRRFLQGMAAGAAAVAGVTVAGALPSGAALASSSGPADDSAVGMLVDLTRCTGCNACALACKEANGRANPTTIPTKLDTDSFSYVEPRTAMAPNGAQMDIFIKHNCMHCLHPACASACTVGALRKLPEGPVVYDAAKCIGCRYCQYACPFGVPNYEWEGALGLISKCELCASRLADGESPACVDACPNGAIHYGTRSFLLAQAKALIASNPGRYVDHIYGEHEVGGTSMLYLSPVPFSALGFPGFGDQTISHHAEAVMKKTPVIALTVATLAAAVQTITKRMAHNGRHEAEFVPSAHDEQGGAQ